MRKGVKKDVQFCRFPTLCRGKLSFYCRLLIYIDVGTLSTLCRGEF
jgi:hypothetical protein